MEGSKMRNVVLLMTAWSLLASPLLLYGREQDQDVLLKDDFRQLIEQKHLKKTSGSYLQMQWRFCPSVITNDGRTKTDLVIEILSGDASFVTAAVTGNFFINGESVEGKELILQNNGDEKFILSGISYSGWPERDSGYYYSDEIGMLDFGEIFVNNDTTNFFQYGCPKIGILKYNYFLDENVIQISDSVQLTGNFINVVESEGDLYPYFFRWRRSEREIERIVTEKVYPNIGDDSDFLVFLSNRHLEGDGLSNFIHAFTIIQSNPGVNGIGLARDYNFNHEWNWQGGTPNLISTVYMDISHITSGMLTHELTHWCCWLDPNLGLMGNGCGNHWVSWSSIAGILGGSLWQENGFDSNFIATGFGTKVGDYTAIASLPSLELYLWGLIDSSYVDPLYITKDQWQNFFNPGEIIHNPFDTVTVVDIVKRHGLRSPTPENSPKVFKAAFISVTDALLQPIEVAFFQKLIDLYCGNQVVEISSPKDAQMSFLSFYQMTRGLATLNPRIQKYLLGVETTHKNNRKSNSFFLLQNYPNPFNPITTIQFSLQQANHVILKIYDLLGNEIATLADKRMAIGQHSITWDASKMSSGVYIYRISAGEFSETKKMTLLK